MSDREIKEMRYSIDNIKQEIALINAKQSEMIKRIQRLEIVTCDGETPEGGIEFE